MPVKSPRYEDTFPIFRRQLFFEAHDIAAAFERISREFDIGSEGDPVHEEFTFTVAGHLFSVNVQPIGMPDVLR